MKLLVRRPNPIKVPEPQEVLSWLVEMWRRGRAYWRAPERKLLVAILALGALLRLLYLDLAPFGAPAAQALTAAAQIGAGQAWPLTGLRVGAGYLEPPLLSYLLALPTVVTRTPLLAVGGLAILNLGAVLALYLLLRHHYGARVAVLGAAFLAVNPWAIQAARQLTSAGLVVPLATLLLASLYAALVAQRPWGWVASGLTVGALMNVSLSAWPLGGVLLLLVVSYRRRVRVPYALLGLSLALILSLPYLYYENLHRLADLRALWSDIVGSEGWGLDGAAWSAAAALHAGGELATLGGISVGDYHPGWDIWRWLTRGQELFFELALPWLVVLALRSWGQWKRRRDPALFIIPAVWLWVTLALLSGKGTGLTYAMLLLLCPAGCLALALLWDSLFGLVDLPTMRQWWWSPYLKVVVGALVLAGIVWQSYNTFYLYTFLSDHDVTTLTTPSEELTRRAPLRALYATPYRLWARTAAMVQREAAATSASRVWVVADEPDARPLLQGASEPHGEASAVLSYLLAPQIKPLLLNQHGGAALLLPAAQPGVYLLLTPASLVERVLRQVHSEEKGRVLYPSGQVLARLEVAQPQAVEETLALIPTRKAATFDAGWYLLGYEAPAQGRAGQTLTLGTYWTILDVPAIERTMQHRLSLQLLTLKGKTVWEREALGVAEAHWEAGDVVVQWFEMTLPPQTTAGSYTLLLAMNRLDDGQRNRVLSERAEDLGDAVVLGTLTVSR